MTVAVQCQRRRLIPEQTLHHFDVRGLGDREACACVVQVVDSHTPATSAKVVAELLWMAAPDDGVAQLIKLFQHLLMPRPTQQYGSGCSIGGRGRCSD
jgi:hypothetical protein